MVNGFYRIVVLTSLCVLGYLVYQRDYASCAFVEPAVVEPAIVEPTVAEPTYPDWLTLEHMDGRCLEVQLTGRNSTEIAFIRDSDGASFIYPIRSLSQATQGAVMAFPESGIEDPFPLQVGLGSDCELKLEIALLEAKLKEVREAYAEARSNGRRRHLRQEWHVISEKIKDLGVAAQVGYGLDEMHIDGLNTAIIRLEGKLKSVRLESRAARSSAARRRLRLERDLIAEKIQVLEVQLFERMS